MRSENLYEYLLTNLVSNFTNVLVGYALSTLIDADLLSGMQTMVLIRQIKKNKPIM